MFCSKCGSVLSYEGALCQKCLRNSSFKNDSKRSQQVEEDIHVHVHSENKVAKWIKISAYVLLIIGMLIGLINALSMNAGFFDLFIIFASILTWTATYLVFLFFLGLAEIIDLLARNNQNHS